MVWASPSPGWLVMTSSRVTSCCCWARDREVRQRLAQAKHPKGGHDSLNTLHCQPWACLPPPHTPSILFWKIQRKRHPQAAWGRRQGGVAEPGSDVHAHDTSWGSPRLCPGPVAGLVPRREVTAYVGQGQTPFHTLKLDLTAGPVNTSLGGRMRLQPGKGPEMEEMPALKPLSLSH